MSLVGKNGLPGIAELCYRNAQYAADELTKLKSFKLLYNNRNFVKEFVLWGAGGLGYVIGILLYGIWGGIALGVLGFGCGFYILSKRKKD